MKIAQPLSLLFLGLLFFVPALVLAATPDPAAHWNFDESGSTVNDVTGNDNDGTLQNGAGRFVGTINGNKLLLDGDDDFVEVDAGSRLNGEDEVTIAAFIRPEANSGTLLFKGDGSPSRYQFGIRDDGRLFFRAGRDQTTGAWATDDAITLDSWSHVAVTYDFSSVSQNAKFYVAGERVDSSELVAPVGQPTSDSSALRIGNNVKLSSGFDGRVDDVKIFREVLTASEVLAVKEGNDEVQDKPNIIVIMTDDQRDDADIATYMSTVKDRLIDEGVTFENSFVDNSLCCPARATFLTGQYSHNNGVFMIGSSVPFNGRNLTGNYSTLHQTQDNTLPVWLQEAGYVTGMFGKYVNGYGSTVSGDIIPDGWDRWFTWINDRGISYYNYDVNDDGTRRSYGSDPSDYFTDVIASEAVEFIEERSPNTQPFFMYFNPFAPHTEVTFTTPISAVPPDPAPRHKGDLAGVTLPRPPSFNEADVSDKPGFINSASNDPLSVSDIAFVEDMYQARLESLLSVDEAIADMIAALEAAGELDNTIIIYTSDNGYFQGEHRMMAGKRLVYEESVRVPLIIRGPDVPDGQSRSQLVNNTDLVATIVDLAEADARRTLDGRSVVPAIENQSTSWRSTLLMQAGNKFELLPQTDQTLYGIYQAVRTPRFVYAEHELPGGAKEEEFYDLQVDPYQLESKILDPNYTDVITELADRLDDMRGCQGGNCWITETEPTLSTVQTTSVASSLSVGSGAPQTANPTQMGAVMQSGGQCSLISSNLYQGVRGSEVSFLQQFLQTTGDFTYPEVTDYFGPATTAAVESYQCREMGICSGTGESNGYGVVGPMTRANIQNNCGGSMVIPTAAEIAATMNGSDQSAKLNLLQQLVNIVAALQDRLTAQSQ